MQRYIEQLIDDIHEATWQVRPPHEIWDGVDMDSEGEIEDFAYVEEYIYGEKELISDITGIETEKLPDEEKLSEEQKTLLATELEKLLEVFNFYLDFPENYPVHMRYKFIRKLWDEKHVPISFGESHIELCDLDETNCPFPGYCSTCEEFNKEYEEGKEDLDFPDFDINDLLPKIT